jgi:RimJ/RimL family protein N-acetyltransferase
MDEAIRVPQTATAPGLLLRPWTENDIPALLTAHQDPVLRRWLRRPVTSAEQARDIIARQDVARRAGTGFSFAVQVIDDADGNAGGPVGGMSLRGLGERTPRGGVGYWTAPRARGQGVAPRALSAVCAWAFDLPRPRMLDGLELIHAVGNEASCRVAVKAGFTLSAVLPPLPPEFPHDGHLHIRLARLQPLPVMPGQPARVSLSKSVRKPGRCI